MVWSLHGTFPVVHQHLLMMKFEYHHQSYQIRLNDHQKSITWGATSECILQLVREID